MILKSFAADLKYRNQAGVNSVRLTVVRSNNRQLHYTLGAMLLAIVLGMLFKLSFPESVNQLLNLNLFTPIKTMFMNGLKMVVAPVVFFSIISAVGQFGNLSEMGKIGGKVLGLYLLTTVFATATGIGIGCLLQLIFLAVICGIASGMIGSHGKTIHDLISACNELFLKITTLLIKFMPIAVFCSILSLPLGATMNMDGTCVYLGVAVLGLAKLYGVEIMDTNLLPIATSIIVLSVGAPGV